MKFLGRLEDLDPNWLTMETRIDGCFGCGGVIGSTLKCAFCLTARSYAAAATERIEEANAWGQDRVCALVNERDNLRAAAAELLANLDKCGCGAPATLGWNPKWELPQYCDACGATAWGDDPNDLPGEHRYAAAVRRLRGLL